jgi:hypothetical protein
MADPYSLISRPFLNEQQCREIIDQHDHNLEHVEQSIYRKVNIKLIDVDEIPGLTDLLFQANDRIFNFDLNGESEIYFARYEPGDHYDKVHIDSLPAVITRKISFTLFLNDDYQGGDFEIIGEMLGFDKMNTTRKGKLRNKETAPLATKASEAVSLKS